MKIKGFSPRLPEGYHYEVVHALSVFDGILVVYDVHAPSGEGVEQRTAYFHPHNGFVKWDMINKELR